MADGDKWKAVKMTDESDFGIQTREKPPEIVILCGLRKRHARRIVDEHNSVVAEYEKLLLEERTTDGREACD